MLSLLSLSVFDPTQQDNPADQEAAPHASSQGAALLPDWSGRSVAVIGAGRPAQTAVRNIERLTTLPGSRPLNVHWLIDDTEPRWQSELDEFIAAGESLADDSRRFLAGDSPRVLCWTEARVTAIEPTPNQRVMVKVRQPGDAWAVEVDRVLSLG